MSPDEVGEWVTCGFCGAAGPPGASCPICGAAQPVVNREIPGLPRRRRYRVRLLQVTRVLVVVAVVVGLAVAIGSAVWSGPPTFPDPLTTRGTLSIPAGHFAYLSGWITGEDYIDGNFSVVAPAGVPINFAVYNSTQFAAYSHGRAAATIWSTNQQPDARIIFAAPYTDTFYLVFQNPYPATSGINVAVYEVTNYQTNVVIG